MKAKEHGTKAKTKAKTKVKTSAKASVDTRKVSMLCVLIAFDLGFVCLRNAMGTKVVGVVVLLVCLQVRSIRARSRPLRDMSRRHPLKLRRCVLICMLSM